MYANGSENQWQNLCAASVACVPSAQVSGLKTGANAATMQPWEVCLDASAFSTRRKVTGNPTHSFHLHKHPGKHEKIFPVVKLISSKTKVVVPTP